MTALVAALLAGIAAWVLVPRPEARLEALGATRKVPPRWRSMVRWVGRGGAKQVEGLPEALDLIAVCLDAGRPLSGSVPLVAEVTSGEVRHWLDRVHGRLRLGQTGAEAWQGQGTALQQVAREITRAERSGTQLAPVLREVSADLRRDAAEADLAAARRVGVRSVLPLTVCFLPAFVLVGVVPIIAGLLGRFLQ